MLVHNDLSDWLLLVHLYHFFAAVVKCAVAAVTHDDVEGGNSMVDDANNLVAVAELLLWGMLVVYNFMNKLAQSRLEILS